MFKLIKLLISLAILAVAFVVGDRVAAHAAASRMAGSLQTDAGLTQRPHVVVHGWPFVTQAVKGHYRDIEVDAGNIFSDPAAPASSAASAQQSSADLQLFGVHIGLGDAISGKVASVPVDSASGTATITYADLAAASKIPGLTVTAAAGQPGELTVAETVSVLGKSEAATVTGTVAASGHTITVTATDVSVAGATLPADVVAALRSHAGFSVQVPGLPSGLSLGAVSAGTSSISVAVSATDVVLSR